MSEPRQLGNGLLLVVSAPSGTGKSTVVRRLLERAPDVVFSVSYTTRPRRDGEVDGRDYHFVGRERFEAMAARGELLEWAEVYGHLYGTGMGETREAEGRGAVVVLDVDVQGARQVRERRADSATVMLLPPDYATLETRLRRRGSEDHEVLARRLAHARREAEEWQRFDYAIVNDDVERATSVLESIVAAERHRAARAGTTVRRILETFPRL
jgi:guanylate kinase